MIEDEQSEKGKEMQQSEMTEVEKEDVSGEQPPETAAMSGDSQPEEKLEVREAEEQERKKEPEISEQKEGEEGEKAKPIQFPQMQILNELLIPVAP